MKQLTPLCMLMAFLSGHMAYGQTPVLAVDVSGNNFYTLDTAAAAFTENLTGTLTMANDQITGCTGLAVQPCTGTIYAVVKDTAAGSRKLVTVDPVSGVCTLVGDLGDKVSAITFTAYDRLYAVTGLGANNPKVLYRVDPATAVMTQDTALGLGADGEVICFNPDDTLIYHWSGNANIDQIFQQIDTLTNHVMMDTVPRSGYLHSEITCAMYFGNGTFLTASWPELMYYDTTGFVSYITTNSAPYKGLAFPLRYFFNTGSDTIIPGDSTLLVATTPATSYQWTFNGTPIPGATNDSLYANNSGNYNCLMTVDSCTYGVGNGLNISYLSQLALSLGVTPNDTICPGDTVTIMAYGADTFDYQGAVININDSTVMFAPQTTDSVLVYGYELATGYVDSAWMVITVNNAPVVTVTPSTTYLCTGDSVLLIGATGGTLQWLVNGSAIAGANNSTYYASATGYYNQMKTNSKGCSDTAAVGATVVVNSGVSLSVVVAKDTICEGTQVSWSVGGANSYTWSPSTGLSSDTGNTVTGVPSAGITYYVIGDNGCVDSVVVPQTILSPNMSYTQSSGGNPICQNETDVVTISGTNLVNFEWILPTGTIYTTNNVKVFNPGVGTTPVTVVGFDSQGCSDTVYVTIVVDTCVGINPTILNYGISHYLSHGQLVIAFAPELHGTFTIELYNLSGSLIMRDRTTNPVLYRHDMSALPASAYVVHITGDQGNYSFKFVKH